MQAANYLNIKNLLDLTCQTVADMIKGKTPEEIRTTFNIKNDFTPEEEEEVRRENQWAFEWSMACHWKQNPFIVLLFYSVDDDKTLFSFYFRFAIHDYFRPYLLNIKNLCLLNRSWRVMLVCFCKYFWSVLVCFYGCNGT